MGHQYTEDGERVEFVGLEETFVRGSLSMDEMGCRWINDHSHPSEFGAESLYSIMPQDVEKGEEYTFSIKVCVRKPTGEYRDE